MVSNKLVIDSGRIDNGNHLIGPREDGALYFNSSLIDITRYFDQDKTIEFLWIAFKNLCEVLSRTITLKKSADDSILYVMRLFAEINKITNGIKIDNPKWVVPPIYSFDPSNPDIQPVMKFGQYPSFIGFEKEDLRGVCVDGLQYLPMTFLSDLGMRFEMNNMDFWCEDKVSKLIDQMGMQKLRLVIVWIHKSMKKVNINHIRIMLRKIGFEPIFMNIDLLNAENSRRIETKYAQKSVVTDYFHSGDIYHTIRVPEHSFDEILQFYQQAADNPNVESIFMTVYRVKPDGKLVDILRDAIKKGKKVFIYVELSARGNEKNNFMIAKKLRDAGAMVRMSYAGMKVHSKMGMIVMKNGTCVVHMATGNFHETTSKVYTDIHVISNHADDVIQVQEMFDALGTGIPMKQKIKDIILKEIRVESSKGINGRIMIKTNHTIDDDLKRELKLASQCGCSIKLITRTTLGILPQEIGSEVITVVGDLLEHERIYGFGNKDDIRVYLSSSDLMFRNLYKRMEILFKLRDDNLAWQLMKENWYN